MFFLLSQILTKDSVTVAVDAVVYYRIFHPLISVCNVANASQSTKLLAQTTLRNILGTKTLSEILQDRENISGLMQVGFQTTNYRLYCIIKLEFTFHKDNDYEKQYRTILWEPFLTVLTYNTVYGLNENLKYP